MACRADGCNGYDCIPVENHKTQPSMAQFIEIARLLQVDIKDLIEMTFDSQNNIDGIC